MRLAVGLSGGADSVALLCALTERNRELGLVLHAAHLHHGLRGTEADADLEFARELAGRLSLPFHEARVDTAAEARANPINENCSEKEKQLKDEIDKPGESIETAARRVRYRWFRELMAAGTVDAVATAHTLDDQAETVLAKFLRGAWTEGLSGIHPVIEFPEGSILRPLLGATRSEVEAFLHARGQNWREDSTNRHLTFTRNRIRHELLPELENWNPQLREHLAQMAELARDEESWWDSELPRLAAQLNAVWPAGSWWRPCRCRWRRAGFGKACRAPDRCAAPSPPLCGRAVGRSAGFSGHRSNEIARAHRSGRSAARTCPGPPRRADSPRIASHTGADFAIRAGG